MSARAIVLLCTYNEVENLPELFAQLGRYLPCADILVVDDNSPDGTAAWVRSHPNYRPHSMPSIHPALVHTSVGGRSGSADDAQNGHTDRPATSGVRAHSAVYIIERGGKQGLGTATRVGLQWCVDRAYDFIINLDADLSHPPERAPQLLSACQRPIPPHESAADGQEPAADGQEPAADDQEPAAHDQDAAAHGYESVRCDVAIGSRYVAGGSSPGLPSHRRWISRLLNVYANRLLRLPVKDCSGSFRCYRSEALRKIDLSQLSCPGYGFLEELLVALHRSGARLEEFPIEFRERSGGHSKLSLSDAWGAIRVIHRLAFSRRASYCRDE